MAKLKKPLKFLQKPAKSYRTRRLLTARTRKSAARSGNSRKSLATLPTYIKKAFLRAESRGKRKQAAANGTVTLPTRWPAVAMLPWQEAASGGKLCQGAGQEADSIRLAAPSLPQLAAPCCHFPQYGKCCFVFLRFVLSELCAGL